MANIAGQFVPQKIITDTDTNGILSAQSDQPGADQQVVMTGWEVSGGGALTAAGTLTITDGITTLTTQMQAAAVAPIGRSRLFAFARGKRVTATLSNVGNITTTFIVYYDIV